MPEFVNPREILNKLNLKKEMIAADFGCGSGSWTLSLAKILEKGKVWAIDIQPEPLSVLSAKAKAEKIFNIQKVIANVEEKIVEIEDLSCDLVLMTNLLFQIENKEAVFKEVKRILKPGGKILIIEWIPAVSFVSKEKKISSIEIKKISQKFGFYLEKEFKAGDYHFGLIFVKS